MESNYITKEGAKRLADELRKLVEVDRPRVVQEVSDAAAQGDRSENAEYIYGKKRLREIDRRIQFLQKRLDAAVVVRAEEQRADVVVFGATVEVEDEDGKRACYTLVGADESEPGRGRLSWKSPVGRALLKKRVGDVVLVQRPAGEIELEILSIRVGEVVG
ncbi:MAG TPA: transcription elongation factor GreB [Polyangiaceae bacterium]|nr:transcription elongation factor GreB [Polyangiaceae bacterium]